ASFTVEAFAELRLSGERLGEDFDGDRAIEARVASAIHLPHATLADQGNDLVCAEPGAGGQRHFSSVSELYESPDRIDQSKLSVDRAQGASEKLHSLIHRIRKVLRVVPEIVRVRCVHANQRGQGAYGAVTPFEDRRLLKRHHRIGFAMQQQDWR